MQVKQTGNLYLLWYYHVLVLLLVTGKQEIIPFMAANPGVTCDSWTTIRTKVMNEQMAVKNKLKKFC